MRNGRGITILVVALCACGVAAGQPARIIYVDTAAVGANDGSSWPGAYVYLQDGLAEAAAVAPPVEVRVAQGLYKPDQGAGITPGDRDATFQLLNRVAVKGGYAGAGGADPDARDVEGYTTVLSGTLGALDDLPIGASTRVVAGDLTDVSAVIDGFTITGWFSDGMYIDTGSPTIRNCIFESNDYGLEIHGGSPSLVDCRFSENFAHAIHAQDCNSILTRCVFERRGFGLPGLTPAIFCVRSNLKLTDCTFTENANGGIWATGTLDLVRCSFVGISKMLRSIVDCFGTLTASDCVFLGNTGEAVYVTGDAEFVGCRFVGNSDTAVSASGAAMKATRCVFSGNFHSGNFHSGIGGGAAIDNMAAYMELSHCIFTGNSASAGRVGAVYDKGRVTRISHCTFAGNRGEPSTINLNPNIELTQCIVWDGPDAVAVGSEGTVTYSNVQGGFAGEGNIDVDPCFVDPGYWDANDTPDDPADDVWIAGDYHLKSQAGHWDTESGSWVLDDVTSPCIDAGDPNGPINAEPFPNGGYANLGAYGATAEASRSYFGGPVCTTQIAGDINGDCQVDDLDMDILVSHWLMEDIGRINVPPTVTIVSPQDGAELSRPEPLVLRFETSDPDGRVIYIGYTLEHDHGNRSYRAGNGARDPGDSWVGERPWSHIPYDGVYVLRAEAIDNEGATTFSPEIKITLHP